MLKNSSSTKKKANKEPEQSKLHILGAISNIASASVAFFGAQYIALFSVAIILSIVGNTKDQIVDIISKNVLVQLATSVLVAIIAIKILLKFINRKNSKHEEIFMIKNKPTWNNVIDVILTYGLYFLTMIIVTIVLQIGTKVDVNQSQELGLARPHSFPSYIQLFLLVSIIPPIFEELLFRGYLFNNLSKNTTILTATILTSFLFGAAHLEYDNLNYIAAIDTMIFSVFLIYISQKHKSIYSSMMMHAIKNSIAFYVLFVR